MSDNTHPDKAEIQRLEGLLSQSRVIGKEVARQLDAAFAENERLTSALKKPKATKPTPAKKPVPVRESRLVSRVEDCLL